MGFHFGVTKVHGHTSTAGDGGALSTLYRYKRPELYSPIDKDGAVSYLRIMPNHGTDSTKVIILFPDGEYRIKSTTWVKTGTSQNIRGDTTANWTTGNVDGVYSPYVGNLPLYTFIYAVKNTYDGGLTFVMMGGNSYTMEYTNTPNLDTLFGANSWVYLGTVCCVSGGSNWYAFSQCGNQFMIATSFTGAVSSKKLIGLPMGGGTGQNCNVELRPGSIFFPYGTNKVLMMAVAADATLEARLVNMRDSSETVIAVASLSGGYPALQVWVPLEHVAGDLKFKCTLANGGNIVSGADMSMFGWVDGILHTTPVQLPVLTLW